MCQVLCFWSDLFFSKNFVIEKHASYELLSFRIVKIPFIKKNVKHSQTERVKKRYQQISSVKFYVGPLVLAAL